MKKSLFKRILVVMFLGLLVLGASCKGCKKDDDGNEGGNENKVYYDNETSPLVFSSAEVDKVFNPFFSTSAADGSVVGMTQIGMLSNDKDCKPVYAIMKLLLLKI